MVRAKLILGLLILSGFVVVAVAAFKVGQWADKSTDGQGQDVVFHTQAVLAFAHYTSYERIRDLLERKCYDAALTVATQMRNLQINLLSDNLKKTGSNPELQEYVRFRNPQLLKEVMEGHVPELESYTTTCPGQKADLDKGPKGSGSREPKGSGSN